MNLDNGLIWCSTPRATVGLVVTGGVITDAPPYAAKWALGRDAAAVWRSAEARGAILVWMPQRRGKANWVSRTRGSS